MNDSKIAFPVFWRTNILDIGTVFVSALLGCVCFGIHWWLGVIVGTPHRHWFRLQKPWYCVSFPGHSWHSSIHRSGNLEYLSSEGKTTMKNNQRRVFLHIGVICAFSVVSAYFSSRNCVIAGLCWIPFAFLH